MRPTLRTRGLLCITDDVAAGIAREQTLDLVEKLRGSVVDTELGPAVLLRDVERLTDTGGES